MVNRSLLGLRSSFVAVFAKLLFAIILLSGNLDCLGSESDSPKQLHAGVSSVDISPTQKSSIIAGGFLEAQANRVNDRLFVRCVVLDDGKSKIAMAIVDTCMMTQSLIDQAKLQASKECGIPVDHMMVSATHTHSAPAAMGCLGTRQDKEYALFLPGKIAEAIVIANSKLQPAKIGWSSIDDWEHTHNRRWIRKPENKIVDPFGNATGIAHMHPGYLSPDVIGPSGPVDPGLSVISVQTTSGRPLAVVANYSQHYFGEGPISADYFGRFSKYVAELLGEKGEGNGPFICVMSQGTSGDLMWMDYGSPAKQISIDRYAEAVARYAERAIASITYSDSVPLGIVEKQLSLAYRVPDSARLEWAKPIAAKIENELPKSLPEVYAMEAMILHERQRTEIKLQAIRIGDLTISTLPNEVYALTGLKLKAQAPSTAHFNIELANGAEGYIPPPEQHTLGGYTTWPARTAGLEVQAETKIVETLLGALEQVTGEPRRAMNDEHGEYAQAILRAKPADYWRLDDADGTAARNAIQSRKPAVLAPGFAWYLPGVGSGTGIGEHEQLTPSAFSAYKQINRAVHLAGGHIQTDATHMADSFSIALWVWLGERSGASARSGQLVTLPWGDSIIATNSTDHSVRLSIGEAVSKEVLRADDWNFVVIKQSGKEISVFVNGESKPTLTTNVSNESTKQPLRFGEGLQGKLDEIAVFDRPLSTEEVASFWDLSGIPAQREQELTLRKQRAADLASRINPPKFPLRYTQSVADLKPVINLPLDAKPDQAAVAGQVAFTPETFAQFRGGRIESLSPSLTGPYSISLWFRCETPNNVQPVTAYFFSRGPNGSNLAPGDHLGIGGTFQADYAGKLLFFNGNESDQVAVGSHIIPTETWNHVVMIRDANRVRAYLNGEPQPEIDAEVVVTATGNKEFFLGARSDQFAPLYGQLAQFALFDRPLSVDEVQLIHAASGQPVGTPKPVDRAPPKPDSDPISPQESLSKIHVPAGYRVELVASEPQVVDPVAMEWDASGQLWVVEMADYPMGMDGAGKAGGRVRVLSDSDSDGHFETSRIFAENLNFPNGILTWRDGVIVTAAPDILFLRDSDGDGKADHREVLMRGFNEGNQQLRVNGLRWGLDGWVYCANGGHHPGHGVGTQVHSLRNGQTYEIGSRDFRFQPDTGLLELESGPSQYGRNRDAWGHWFGVQNANPLWHYVIPDRYLSRNPHVPSPPPIRHIVGPGSPIVYPASALEKRYHSFEQSGRFTSACSAMIYNDDLLFGSGNELHAFTCEPFHNLVQHNVLTDAGVSFVASRADGEEKMDFFASEDRWCRPVMARTGPDGELWIADMYRYMIEHPEWLPNEGKNELLPHYRLGEDRGRIYRIVPKNAPARKSPPLDKLSLEQLVVAMDSPNDWQRDKVQQMLLWRNDVKAVSRLELLATESQRPQTRVQALYTLHCLKSLSASILIRALQDKYARVREHAILLAESQSNASIIRQAVKLASDPDAKVRLQLALTLGQWTDPVAGKALGAIAVIDADDPMMVAAIMSSALKHSLSFIPAILKSPKHVADAFRESLLRQSLGSGDLEGIQLMLSDAVGSQSGENVERLHGLMLALERVGSSLDQLAKNDATASLKPSLDAANRIIDASFADMTNPKIPEAHRIAAATLVSRTKDHRNQATAVLAQWLQPQVAPEKQSQIIQALSQSAADSVPGLLAQAWPRLSPTLRTQALDAWMSRSAWTEDLLTRIEKSEIARGSLDLTQQARLKSNPNQILAERAKALLTSDSQAVPKQVVQQYRAALELKPDIAKGKFVYTQSCAKCHRRGNEGHDVGPNLASVINHPPEKLLTNILDPNSDIQPGFQAYVCLLETGEVLSGLLSGETANSLTISQANGVTRTVGRNEIEEFRNLGVSLMPEGIEATLSHQDIADLIAFLRQPIASAEAVIDSK